jgi:hypothetical protein
MKRFAAVALASFCLMAGSAHAQQLPAPAPAAAATPSPRALALTKRYIAALHINETMKPMMKSMFGPVMDEQMRTYPNVTDEQRKAARETIEDFIGGDLMDEVLERMTPIYATAFSEDELQALVDFYESPNGQSIVRKMPLIGPAAARVVVEMAPQIRAEVAQRMCKKLGCEKTPSHKASPS